MYEHRRERLLTRRQYLLRQGMHLLIALSLMATGLAIGALGYRTFEGMGWIEATYNAAMIVTGMGPAEPLRTDAGRVFAIVYALLSSLLLITTATVLVAPVLHRILHRLHLEDRG